MKVDIIINSMIHQIDRNLQTQVTPALSFRAGEILRGRVMLNADDRLQIRLDSGALLNALPAGDVFLTQGATVTLRVSGRMDGNFVMQLLEQELAGELISGRAANAEEAALGKLGLDTAPQGGAVLESMRRMGLPLSEETAGRAMEILRRFPDLEPDKAVFMAANRMPATRTQADALNRLVDGRATTGGELLKLADMLTSQALAAENVHVMEDGGRAAPKPTANPLAPAAEAEGEGLQAAANAAPQADPETSGAPSVSVPAVSWQSGPKAPQQDGMLRLQSLALVALGQDDAERYAGLVAKLSEHGALPKAVALALDGPFMTGEQLAGELRAFEDALPEGLAREARAFVGALVEGVGRYMVQNGAETLLPRQPAADSGIARIIKEIMDMFVPIDRGEAFSETSPGEKLAQAAGAQREGVARLADGIARSGAAGPEAVRQLDAVTGQVRLLSDISQYVCQQIPVQVNGRNCTAEIYVLNRGRRGRKISAESAHMLIALDTEHMGRVEALASISKKSLRLRFGVERPGLMALVNAHAAELSQAMKEIGFRLSDVRTQVIGKPVNAMTVAQAVEPAYAGSLDLKV
jgi:hypothetical protein